MPLLSVGALVLAGGKGTRMHSDTPKVLQKILGEPLLTYVYDALEPLCGEAIWTIVGHKADMITQAFPQKAERSVLQTPQLGTGHALATAWPILKKANLQWILVVNGDTPQLDTQTLQNFLAAVAHEKDVCGNKPSVSFLSLTLDNPGSLGRVVRKNGAVTAIIEAKDYDDEIHGRDPHEVNGGVYCLAIDRIDELLPLLSDDNKAGEFYITDIIGLAVKKGLHVAAFSLGTDTHLMGVNSPKELSVSEDAICQTIVKAHMTNGVIIRNAQTVRISPYVTIAKGADITGPCEIYGTTTIGSRCIIEAFSKIVDSTIAHGSVIRSFSHLEKALVGDRSIIGPYARLRPGSHLKEDTHIGNFVEIKKSVIEPKAKVNHLTYIGDAFIGEGANIGAGTITCNYDGENKHHTHIGKQAFIGSNSALVAPVRIGDNTLIGAGSVITEDVPDNMLALTRSKQTIHPKKTKS